MAYVRWGEIETIIMLDIVQELDIVQLLAKQSDHFAVFGKISESMAERGFRRTADQVKTRWRNLKCIYRDAKRKLRSSPFGFRKPKFFDEMDEILKYQPASNMEESSDSQTTPVHQPSPRTSTSRVMRVPQPVHNIDESSVDSQPSTPVRPPSSFVSTFRNRRIVIERARGRRTSFDDSLKRFALLNKELLTEMFTSVNKDSNKFIAAEMEKQRSFDKEMLEADHSHMKASLESMMRMFLAFRSQPTLLSQPSRTSGDVVQHSGFWIQDNHSPI